MSETCQNHPQTVSLGGKWHFLLCLLRLEPTISSKYSLFISSRQEIRRLEFGHDDDQDQCTADADEVMEKLKGKEIIEEELLKFESRLEKATKLFANEDTL